MVHQNSETKSYTEVPEEDTPDEDAAAIFHYTIIQQQSFSTEKGLKNLNQVLQ